MIKILSRFFRNFNYPSYFIFFVTSQCNANCKMCFYTQNMEANRAQDELTLDEYRKIAKQIPYINILGISGGEPFLRKDLKDVVCTLYDECRPLVIDLPTNGYFTERIVTAVEAIAAHCQKTKIDIQISIDGPCAVHNDIRGLDDGFERLTETYKALIPLKKKYRNLRLKGCVVYSAFNQDYISELFDVLDRDFKDFDRIVFSVAHGTVDDEQAMEFDWERYFEHCEILRRMAVVDNPFDFYSIFTIALRIAKNDLLERILIEKDMFSFCKAGKKVIVVGETGNVFPCEPLWEKLGNLRDFDYNVGRFLKSDELKAFTKKIKAKECTCHWGLPMSNTLIFSPQ
ncbi:radical SAM protein, partial [Candidatus Omnitrophota bacterium]